MEDLKITQVNLSPINMYLYPVQVVVTKSMYVGAMVLLVKCSLL